ncbi:MAG: tetratricopeptide repeat protein [Clostridia bacterium]|nr:tetratricopeptide repeat protein [Clostridia bacterium]
MGILDSFKARKALMAQQKGNVAEARKLYEEMYSAGYFSAAYMLPFSVLLLREGGEDNYLKVKEILKKAEKAPDLDAGRKQQLFMNYAVAQYKLGEIEKAIQLLEASHRKAPCGLTYQSLGWLYIEAGDAEKALAYNQEALDYDDEDPIVLDNLGQTYYRLLNDKEKAKEYFDKAIGIKDSQIDTLYFLAQYDKEEGNLEAAAQKLEKALEGRFSPLNYATKEMIQKELAEIKK